MLQKIANFLGHTLLLRPVVKWTICRGINEGIVRAPEARTKTATVHFLEGFDYRNLYNIGALLWKFLPQKMANRNFRKLPGYLYSYREME